MPCLSVLIIVFAFAAFAQQKKPVTLDAIFAERPSERGRGMSDIQWAPDGKSFVYRQAGKVHLYDIASRKSRELFTTSGLATRAVKTPSPDRFMWENRGVHEDDIQW